MPEFFKAQVKRSARTLNNLGAKHIDRKGYSDQYMHL